MTEQKRLEEIKELLAIRNSHVVNGEVDDYQKYDEPVNSLNDDGHIDWMVEKIEKETMINELFKKRIEELEKENKGLNQEIGQYSEQVYKLSQSIGANVADLNILSTRILQGNTP